MSLFLKAVDNCVIANGGSVGRFILRGEDNYENIEEWFCDADHIPTKQQVETEYNLLKTEWDASQYQRLRARLYPTAGELADAIYHKEKHGDDSLLQAYIAKCDAVKEMLPKDNSGSVDFVNPEGRPIIRGQISW